MLENGRSKKENGGVIIEGKKKGHHKDIQRWEMTSRSVKEKKCKSSSTKVRSQKKQTISFGNFSQHGGGVFPNPKTFVNLPSIFLYAKFILRC